MTERLAIFFGSGATKGSGLECDKDKLKESGIHLTVKSDGHFPIDATFWEEVTLDEEAYPALCLLRRHLPTLKSMEKTWSFFNLAHQWGQFAQITKDKYLKKIESELVRMLGEPGFISEFGKFNYYTYLDLFCGLEKEYLALGRRAPCNQTRPERHPHFFCGDADVEFRYLIYKIYSTSPNDQNCSFQKLFRCLNDEKVEFDILTTNYDLFAEKALDRLNIPYWYKFPEPLEQTRTKLIKLHGSLNWSDSKPVPLNVYHPNGIEPQYKRCGAYTQPLMVPPTYTKVEVHNEPDDPNRDNHVRRTINLQWEAGQSILERASWCLIIGYGFPRTDPHAIALFQKTLKNNTKIFYCDIKDNGIRKILENADITISEKGFEGLDKEINFQRWISPLQNSS